MVWHGIPSYCRRVSPRVVQVFAASTLVYLAGCATSVAAETTTEQAADSSGDVADGGGAAACGALPPLDGPATVAYESDTVASLAGAAEITPGVRLRDRSSPANRQIAREYLTRRFGDLSLVPLQHAYGTGTNVYAELPSISSGRDWVVLGAHFDTVARSPGANDNATGVAMVFAVARYLAALPCRAHNVAFVLFDEEESGLVGSKAFARKLERDGVSVRAVHTVDQMGWDRNGDRLIELERPDAGLADLYRAAAADLGVAIPIAVTSTSSSDHSSFRPRFPAVGITEGYRSGDTTPDYHRPTDTHDKVDFEYLRTTTELVARVFANQLR